MSSFGYVAGAVADVLMPRQCVVCGRKLLVNERHICAHCLHDMPFTYNWENVHNPMADRFNEVIQRNAGMNEPYAYAAGLFFFRSGSDFRNICYRLKYHGDIAVGRRFARMLGQRLAGSAIFHDVDAVIPMPLHWTRHLRRGYNQAEVIAREIAHSLGAPSCTDILKRNRRTKTQTRLDVEQKRINVSGAFSVRKMPHRDIRHILVVDDTFTTGATVGACHAALRKAFSPEVRISVATLAVVGE